MHQPREVAEQARAACSELAQAPRELKDRALALLADKLSAQRDAIRAANEADMARAAESGVDENVVKRLQFGDDKLQSRVQSLRKIVDLPDPVGEVIEEETRPAGLVVSRVRVPIGVIMMVYEARPHVTINAGAFCLKSGNAAILRGGSEARECNSLLGDLWRESVVEAGLPEHSVQVISGSHEDVGELLQLDEFIDLVIPRGGKGLIKAVTEQSRIPVIKHYEGVCHVYLDAAADLPMGLEVALDSKCLMPEVCNAMETVLVHRERLPEMPTIVDAFTRNGVTVKGCEATRKVVPEVELATEEDWRTEYLDLTVSIRVVDSLDAAIAHINTFGSHHTDSIVTSDARAARTFSREVDSAVVLTNASTMYCDGESLGMGAEIGISTDRIHARGPMGLRELTTYKFLIRGEGAIMGPPRYAK